MEERERNRKRHLEMKKNQQVAINNILSNKKKEKIDVQKKNLEDKITHQKKVINTILYILLFELFNTNINKNNTILTEILVIRIIQSYKLHKI